MLSAALGFGALSVVVIFIYGFSASGLAAVLSATLAASGLFAGILSAPEKKTAADKVAADKSDEGAGQGCR